MALPPLGASVTWVVRGEEVDQGPATPRRTCPHTVHDVCLFPLVTACAGVYRLRQLSWFGSSLCPRRRRGLFAVLCRRNQGDHLRLSHVAGDVLGWKA